MSFLSSIPNILLIILGFGVLIFIHEMGHFVAAKWAKIRTEAFAVGMGPVLLAWRKGIGVRFGSTWPAVMNRVREPLKSGGMNVDLTGGDETERRKHIYRAMDGLGIGETEYSLRCLPIGGFVKMLGQEDANPNHVSDDPRSYNMCPVGKRMIVVSAGVIMNLLLAVVLFVIAFTRGVEFPAPMVGDVAPSMSAANAPAENAAALGIAEPGLKPGDIVLQTDDDPAVTFADIQIASAMSRPDKSVRTLVRRDGIAEPLVFNIKPQKDPNSGLLSFGIGPGASTTLMEVIEGSKEFDDLLDDAGLLKAGVKPGMRLTTVADKPVTTFAQVSDAVEKSQGLPVKTQWTAVDEKGRVQAAGRD